MNKIEDNELLCTTYEQLKRKKRKNPRPKTDDFMKIWQHETWLWDTAKELYANKS